MTTLTAYGPCSECAAEALAVMFEDPDAGERGAFTVLCESCGHEMHVPAEASARTRIGALRAIVRDHTAARVDGYIVDATTAHLLVSVYEGLKPANREKFGRIGLMRLVELGWSVAK